MSALKPPPDVPIEVVEWRCDGQPNTKRTPPTVRYVPYISASIAADLLDEWVGNTGWSDDYETGVIDGKPVMWCTLSVRSDDGEWVSHKDVGTVTQFEGQKGAVSDAFKRAACLKWGCGRNVYRLPTMWAPCKVTQRNGKDVAWPNEQTIPTILAELKRLGYGTVEATRVEAEDHGDVDTDTGEVRPYISQENAARALARATADGLNGDDLADAVEMATESRTSKLSEVYRSETKALKEAFEHVTQRKAAGVRS